MFSDRHSLNQQLQRKLVLVREEVVPWNSIRSFILLEPQEKRSESLQLREQILDNRRRFVLDRVVAGG